MWTKYRREERGTGVWGGGGGTDERNPKSTGESLRQQGVSTGCRGERVK